MKISKYKIENLETRLSDLIAENRKLKAKLKRVYNVYEFGCCPPGKRFEFECGHCDDCCLDYVNEEV